NTGAIDPLADISSVCREQELWLHVDGAYGALAALAIPEAFRGLAAADSLSLDPHKWLYQPLDCGLLLYRSQDAARRAFSFTGDYAKSLASDAGPASGIAIPTASTRPSSGASSSVAGCTFPTRRSRGASRCAPVSSTIAPAIGTSRRSSRKCCRRRARYPDRGPHEIAPLAE